MGRDHRMDWLRAAAIIAVLIIHSATRYAQSDAEVLVGRWFALFTRPCIATFLFLAGYFYRTRDLSAFYVANKVRRVVLPYLVFAALSLLYQHKAGILNYLVQRPDEWIVDVLVGNTFGLYYFVFLIVYLYLLAFVVLRTKFLREHLALVTLCALAANLLHAHYFEPLVQQFGIADSRWVALYRERYLLSWPFFFFLGVWFRQAEGQAFVDRHKAAIRGAWLLVFAGYNALYFAGWPTYRIDGYNSIIGTFYSLATIALLLTWAPRGRFITQLSMGAYSIYLSHIFIVFSLDGIGDSMQVAWPFWFSLVSFALSLVGSLAYYWLARELLRDQARVVVGA